MKRISTLILFSLLYISGSNLYADEGSSNNDYLKAEIAEKIKNYSVNELIERREVLINSLEEESEEQGNESTELKAFELSLIEQLLVLAGVLVLDNVLYEPCLLYHSEKFLLFV